MTFIDKVERAIRKSKGVSCQYLADRFKCKTSRVHRVIAYMRSKGLNIISDKVNEKDIHVAYKISDDDNKIIISKSIVHNPEKAISRKVDYQAMNDKQVLATLSEEERKLYFFFFERALNDTNTAEKILESRRERLKLEAEVANVKK